MPRLMNKHGFRGVQMHSYPSRIPYYCQLHVRGRRYQTRGFATAKEAFEAGTLLRQQLTNTARGLTP